MEAWEYKVVSIAGHRDWETDLGIRKQELMDAELKTQLNRWGEEGWECVSLAAGEWHGGSTS